MEGWAASMASMTAATVGLSAATSTSMVDAPPANWRSVAASRTTTVLRAGPPS